MSKRPNILFLFADQHRYDALGVHRPWLRTPALDRLAAEGLLCERVYAPTPVCLPCRASFVTGQYPSTHGAMHNESFLPQDWPLLWAERFGDHGYHTHMIGKSHLNSCHDPASPESLPRTADRVWFRAWHGPWYGFRRADISIGHSAEHITCHMHYGVWLEERGIDPSEYFGHFAYTDFGPWNIPEEISMNAWVAETTIESMRASVEREQPFFIWANFPDPHNPCVLPEPWASMYADADLPDHGFKPGEPECFAEKPPFYAETVGTPGMHRAPMSDPGLPSSGTVCRLPYTPEEARANAVCYYGMVSMMDAYIGRVLDALDESGAAEDTLVVYSADHGDLLGDHGLWWKGLAAYEESMRVPCIVRRPERVPAGARTGALQSLVDLAPTFLEWADIPAPHGLEGVSQLGVWEGREPSARECVVVEDRPFDTDFLERVLVTDEWKLCVYPGRETGELYHTASDPHQIRNLWNDDAHAGTRKLLERMLLAREAGKQAPRPSPSVVLSDGRVRPSRD